MSPVRPLEDNSYCEYQCVIVQYTCIWLKIYRRETFTLLYSTAFCVKTKVIKPTRDTYPVSLTFLGRNNA